MFGNESCKTCNDSLLFQNWSDFCLTNSNDFKDKCFPLDHEVMFAEGIWVIINAMIGVTGNLLTILAIPLAARNNQ